MASSSSHVLTLIYHSQYPLVGAHYSPFRDELFVAHCHGLSSVEGHLIAPLCSMAYLEEGNNRVTSTYDDGVGVPFGGILGFKKATCINENFDGNLILSNVFTQSIQKLDLSSFKLDSIYGNPMVYRYEKGKKIEGRPTYILQPTCALFDDYGNLIIVDTSLHCIIRVSDLTGVTTIAGARGKSGYQDGKDSLLCRPFCALYQPGLGFIFSDRGNHVIRRINSKGDVSTWAGDGKIGGLDGPSRLARFSSPHGLVMNAHMDVLVADAPNKQIRLISEGYVTTIVNAKTRTIRNYFLKFPTGLVLLPNGRVFVVDPVGLFEIDMGYQAYQWKDQTQPKLKFLTSFQEPKSISDSDVVITHPTDRQSIRINRGIISVRCPKLLEDGVADKVGNSGVKFGTIQSLVEFLHTDEIPQLHQSNHLSDVIEMIHISDIVGLNDLQEYMESQKHFSLVNPISAFHLTDALKTSIAIQRESAILDVMRAIVSHNVMFAPPEAVIALRNSAGLYKDNLKLMLARNEGYSTLRKINVRKIKKKLFGRLPACMKELLELSLTGMPSFPDFTLIVQQGNQEVKIPCHKFVLCTRWKFILPMISSIFDEGRYNEMRFTGLDGQTLLPYDWVCRFLRLLYYGDLSFLNDQCFCEELAALASYWMMVDQTEYCWVFNAIRMKDNETRHSLEPNYIHQVENSLAVQTPSSSAAGQNHSK